MNRLKPYRNRPRLGAGVACCVSVLALALSHAAAAEPLTLAAALERARAANPEILAAEQQLEVARARLKKARYPNPFNPQIEGGATARRFDDGGSATQPTGGISLEIEVAGQRGLRIDEAERTIERTGALVNDVVRQITARTTAAYYRALYAHRRLDLFRKVEIQNRRLREAAAEQFRAGEISKLESNLAVVRHSQTRKDTLLAGRDHENALRELERLIGLEPSGTLHLAGNLQIAPIGVDEARLLQIAVAARPDLQARQAELGRIDAEARLLRRSVIPNPTLRGIYEEEAESDGGRDRIAGGTVSIALPIFDRNQAELAALAAERSKALHERTGTILEVKNEVSDAYRSYAAAREAAELFESDAMTPIAENFRFVETAYRTGKINLLELIVVQNDLVGAELSYLETIWEYWAARTALERAVGRPLAERGQP
jgi:cobalt-zinc-cadmium efflux system outer membrane protein